MNRRRIVLGAALVAAIGVFGYQAWADREPALAAVPEAVVVRAATVEIAVEASGSLAPGAEVSLAFPSGGQVADMLVEVGQEVAEGQPLAVLDTRELALQLASAEGSLQAAGSNLSSAQASLAKVVDGADQSDIDIANVNADKARDSLWGVQAQRDAVCGQVEAGRAEQAACDQAQANVLAAGDAVRIAELQLEDLLAGATDTELALARQQVAQADGQLAASQSQADQARLRLEQATLTAPVAGTVTALSAEVGSQVGGTQAVLTISDLSRLEVELYLDETDVTSVVAGQAAQITLSALPDTVLDGEVTAVAPVPVTESGVVLFPVTVRLAPTDEPVRAGMTADVSIVTARHEGALTVPLRAVESEAGRSFVQVLDRDAAPDGALRTGGGAEDRAQAADADKTRERDRADRGALTDGDAAVRRVEVTLGVTTGSEVVVASGLTEGDVVVIDGETSSETDERTESAPPGGPGGPGLGRMLGGGRP